MNQAISTTRSGGLRNRATARSAFTLIELFVVIAIVVVLASLAMPVLGKMRESGGQAKSVSNLRQLALGMMAFSTDNDGRLPGLYGFIPGTPTWDVAIAPYAGGVEQTKKLLADPNDQIKRIPNSSKRSYGYNPVAAPPNSYYIDNLGGGPQLYRGIKVSSIKSPSNFPLLLEEYRDYNVYASNWAEITCGYPVRTMGGKSGTYAAYADGRVAFLPQDLDFDWYQWMNNYLANK
jgi:prepilin-type N-terminal cleavage/methylation domain-containing protein